MRRRRRRREGEEAAPEARHAEALQPEADKGVKSGRSPRAEGASSSGDDEEDDSGADDAEGEGEQGRGKVGQVWASAPFTLKRVHPCGSLLSECS